MNTTRDRAIYASKNLVKVIAFWALTALVWGAFTASATGLRVFAIGMAIAWVLNVAALVFVAGRRS